MYLKLYQAVDQAYPPSDICEKHVKEMDKLMSAQGCHHGLGLMTVLFSVELNNDASSLSSICNNTGSRMLVKSG